MTSSWQVVPGLEVDIETGERDCLTATVSGEAYASSGNRDGSASGSTASSLTPAPSSS
jgi:hypothetical protein